MTEWQDMDSAQIWSEPVTLSPAKDADELEIAQVETTAVEDGSGGNGDNKSNDNENENNDFGEFGNNTGISASSDDFGDFGDFGDFNDFAACEVPDTTPVPAPAVPKMNDQPKIESSPVDRVLEKARPLLDSSSDESLDNRRLAVLSECLEHVFQVDQTTIAPTANGVSLNDSADLDKICTGPTRKDELSLICRSIQNQEFVLPSDEPRLLRNLTLTLVDPKIPEDLQDKLLLPLSDLNSLPEYASEQESAMISNMETKTTLLDIDNIRQLSAKGCDDSDTLKHALLSINALISTKEQELDKRKDAIVAYNQVIQTLVLQAKRLH